MPTPLPKSVQTISGGRNAASRCTSGSWKKGDFWPGSEKLGFTKLARVDKSAYLT